jgi:hypothetical protein
VPNNESEQSVRKLSKIGAIVIAVFALTAIGASAAQATEATFGWAAGTTKIERSANTSQVFTVTNSKETVGSVTCNTVVFNATVGGTGATSVTTNAGTLTYNNSGSADTCPSSLGTATIHTHNCEYQFTPGLSISTGHSTGTVDIVNCPTTAPIEVNVSALCLIKIYEQTGIGPVTYTTTATTPSTITVEINAINNILGDRSGLCGTAERAAIADYVGDVTLEGTNASGVQTAIKVLP